MYLAMALHVLFNPLVVVIMFVYYWLKFFTFSPSITFARFTTDETMIEFADSEDSMIYGKFDITVHCIVKMDTIRYLLVKCPWLRNFKGSDSPLMYAAIRDHSEVVKLLLERGADIEAKDKVILQTKVCIDLFCCC